jgi:hypothetical protein
MAFSLVGVMCGPVKPAVPDWLNQALSPITAIATLAKPGRYPSLGKNAGLSMDATGKRRKFRMSLWEGVSGKSENVAAHPTRGWSQRQQRSREIVIL